MALLEMKRLWYTCEINKKFDKSQFFQNNVLDRKSNVKIFYKENIIIH